MLRVDPIRFDLCIGRRVGQLRSTYYIRYISNEDVYSIDRTGLSVHPLYMVASLIEAIITLTDVEHPAAAIIPMIRAARQNMTTFFIAPPSLHYY